MSTLNLFGGPGGLCLGARAQGFEPLGVESDPVVCQTRRAAGLPTIERDVTELDPIGFGYVEGLLASPTCTPWSQAGSRGGEDDRAVVLQAAEQLVTGCDVRAEARRFCADPDSLLVVEPLRYAIDLRPRWIVLEQVPPVLAVWKIFESHLRGLGYSTWAGILEAERYGVPQTRERAFLLASIEKDVHPPEPTHARYEPGQPPRCEQTLFGHELKPWRSMAEALGWHPLDLVGFPRQADHLAATEDGYRERDRRPAGAPAFALTEKARSWQRWPFERPATTVQGDNRIWPPGHKRNAEDAAAGRDHYGDRAGTEAIRVTVEEAAVLQGFPPGFPFQGSQTKRFEQVGNAVPPALGAAAIGAVVATRHEQLERQAREILQHERARAAA